MEGNKMTKLSMAAIAATALLASSVAMANHAKCELGMTPDTCEAITFPHYSMDVTKGPDRAVSLRAYEEATVKHALKMEAKPAKDGQWKHVPKLRSDEQATVDHAIDWNDL